MKDIKLLLAACGTIAGLAQAEIGGEVSNDTQEFSNALAAVDKSKKPSIDDWTNGAFGLANGIVATLPDGTTKDQVTKLFNDAYDLVLAGEHAKAFEAFAKGIAVIHDIKVLAHKG